MRNIIALSVTITFIFAGCATAAELTSAPVGTEVCQATSEQEISALFDRWNLSLQTGDPHKQASMQGLPTPLTSCHLRSGDNT